MNKILLFMVLLLFACPFMSNGQVIKIIDQQHQTPIVNASYKYGSKHGISDINGEITIQNDGTSSLIVSHVNYGELLINARDLITFIKKGFILWQKQSFELQPVSIIALHEPKADSLSILFNNQNRLSHDASAVLAQIPEVALIRKSGNYGFDPVLRGFKYEQLNIVLDGSQSANAACPNRMDPPSSQMPVNMLSQINVLKGPYSLRYGNAFGGTINFKTEPTNFNADHAIDGRLSGSYESNGNIYRSEGLIGFSGQSHDIKLYGSVSSGDNYKDGEGNKVLSSFYRNNIGALMGFQLSDRQNLKLNVSHNYAKDVDFLALPMDLRKDDTWLGSLHHSIVFNMNLKEWNTSLYSTYVDHQMDNYDKVIDPRMMDAITDAKTYNYGGRTEGTWNFGSNQMFLGMDFRGDKAEGERRRTFLMGPNQGNTAIDNVWQDSYVNKLAAFGEFQHHLNQWQMVYSARVEYNTAGADRPDANFKSIYSDLSSKHINPAVSVGISRKLSTQFKVELWLGHAERSGSLTERYINFLPVGIDPYEMIGNPELASEKNNQMDLNLYFKGKITQVQLTGFVASMNDFISSEIRSDIDPKMPTSQGVRQFINIGKARLAGFEAVWLQKLPAHLNHRLSIAYTNGKNNDTDEALPEIPPMDLRYAITGSYIKNKLQPELVVRHVWKQDRIAESFGETKTPSFSLLDLSVNYSINSHFEVNAAVNNLLDETYYEHLTRSVKGSNQAINAPGRNMILTLVAKL